VNVTRVSIATGLPVQRELPVTQEQLDEFDSGSDRLVQHIFPDLSASDREFLMTGLTDDEWDELMQEPEE
jgi:hypothetical protein